MITMEQALKETGLSIARMRQFCKKENIKWVTVPGERGENGKFLPFENLTEFTDDQYTKLKNRMHEVGK